jgi:hypothetical protein
VEPRRREVRRRRIAVASEARTHWEAMLRAVRPVSVLRGARRSPRAHLNWSPMAMRCSRSQDEPWRRDGRIVCATVEHTKSVPALVEIERQFSLDKPITQQRIAAVVVSMRACRANVARVEQRGV